MRGRRRIDSTAINSVQLHKCCICTFCIGVAQSPDCRAQQNSDPARYGAPLTSTSWPSKFRHPLWPLTSRPVIIYRLTCQYVSGHIERRYQADDSHLRVAARKRRDIPLVLFSVCVYAPASGNTPSIEIKGF